MENIRDLYINVVGNTTKGNDNFRTLKEAKKAVVKYFIKWSKKNETNG